MSRKTKINLQRILKGFPIMTARALFVAAGLLVASFTPAFADSVTAVVTHWDQVTRTITLEDRSQFADIPAEVTVPPLQASDEVTVDYLAAEDGIQAINAITVNTDVAKRLVPLPQKRG
jgi:predicted Zn-dependent protease